MKIGIDMGGSHVAIGIVNENGEIIEKFEKDIKTMEEQAKDEMSTYIIENISKIEQNYDIEKIGIGSPGTPKNGILTNLVNLKIKEFDITSILKEHFDIPVILKNDAKCAGLAEKTYGALKDYQDAVFLCLGTGIGANIFMAGKELQPIQNPGMEIGHMVIDKNGIECNCGKKGCFEKYGNILQYKNKVKERLNIPQEVNAQPLRDIMNPRANEIEDLRQQYISDLAIGISNLVNIFEPDAIILGGGFTHFAYMFMDDLKDKLINSTLLFNRRDDIDLRCAELKNDAAMIGSIL